MQFPAIKEINFVKSPIRKLRSDLQRLWNRKVYKIDPEELKKYWPPEDPYDIPAWDQYWINQMDPDNFPLFNDMFCHDEKFMERIIHLNFKTILCVGNGISQEPRALARAGLQVTAMDFSPKATEIANYIEMDPKYYQDVFPSYTERLGGSVKFVVGDVFDPTVCPGPYDVIIERLTMQNYPEQDQPRFLETISARLNPEGIFYSHAHSATIKGLDALYGQREKLFEGTKWTEWNGGPGSKPPGQVVWFFTSSG